MISTLRHYWGISLVCFFASIVIASAQTTPGVYKSGAIVGSASWTDPVTKETKALTEGEELPQGATISTGVDSSVTLVFANGATATVGENSTVNVEEFLIDPFAQDQINDKTEPSVSQTKINLLKGQVLARAKKLNKQSTFTVNSPVGAAGIRGTVFLLQYDPVSKNLSLSTAEGLVLLTTANQPDIPVASGREVTLAVQVDDNTGQVTGVSVKEGVMTESIRTEILQKASTALETAKKTDVTSTGGASTQASTPSGQSSQQGQKGNGTTQNTKTNQTQRQTQQGQAQQALNQIIQNYDLITVSPSSP